VDAVVRAVYAASYSVVDALGCGLEPHAFRVFLAHALRLKGFLVAEDVAVSASFMGKVLIDAFRVDLLINETVIVDIAANERPMHEHENRLRYFMEQTAAAAAVLLPVCYAGSPADVVVLRGDME
jgi:GxxExxY protein